MPNWHQMTQEVNAEIQRSGPVGCYMVRQKYLTQLFQKTKRNTIVYASNWSWSGVRASATAIDVEDIYGMMTVMSGLSGDDLDLILHTPGGSIAAAEAVMNYLRLKFKNIRVIIPHAAMSAGTVLACGADSLLLGKHSFIGPTDPQVPVIHQTGVKFMAAQSILDDFEMAKRDCASSPAVVQVWTPILDQYYMGLMTECRNAIKLSRDLVQMWLEQYMFAGDQNAHQHSNDIADWLSDHDHFHSHVRFISRSDAASRGLKIENLEADQDLQDLVLSVFHSILIQFAHLPDFSKIMENHLGTPFMAPQP